MPLTLQAQNVIERPLPKEKIRQRPGKAGLTFDYVTPDFIINLLNEAFEYRWSTDIFHQSMHGDTALVGLNLTVWDAEDNAINKSQFGSCDVGRGMGPGEAFKGAASDAMKKSATLLGVALELYNDDEAPKQQFQKPTSRPPAPPTNLDARVGVAPRAYTPPPLPQTATVTPPPPPRPTIPAPPVPMSPVAARSAPVPPHPVTAEQKTSSATPLVVAPKPVNPFANGGTSATIPKPAFPTAPKTMGVNTPKTNPFISKTETSSPNSTQINALTNLAQKKSLSQSEMIDLVGIIDDLGNPKQTYEELTHAEAIQVIKASQL